MQRVQCESGLRCLFGQPCYPGDLLRSLGRCKFRHGRSAVESRAKSPIESALALIFMFTIKQISQMLKNGKATIVFQICSAGPTPLFPEGLTTATASVNEYARGDYEIQVVVTNQPNVNSV